MQSDSESESGSQDYDLHNWPDMNSDDLDLRYSSDEAGSESDYDYPGMLQGWFMDGHAFGQKE